MKKFSIAYQGLSIGNHSFEFEIDDTLFEQFAQEDLGRGNGRAVINLERHPSFMVLDVNIDGELEVTCDRCLDKFMQEVSFEGRLFVKFSPAIEEPEYDVSDKGIEEEVILWINPGDNYLDLAPYIFESMVLSLPVQRIHPYDENGESMCDKDMLARFVLAEEQEEEVDFLQDEDDE